MNSKTAIARAASACAALYLLPALAFACDDCDCDDTPTLGLLAVSAADDTPPAAATRTKLGLVRVQGASPSSLPSNIPTTRETVTREEIERNINATDSEDALKYLPSLLVRKRYIGDYNHAILSSRASGTGNSARSAGLCRRHPAVELPGQRRRRPQSFPPRWGLVTPEEIERVDVMYGPFSAAYPGNSVGAVVDYVTRMPTRFESTRQARLSVQPALRACTTRSKNFRAWQGSVSVGSRSGDLSWWLNFNHTGSEGQPLTFATRLVSSGGSTGTAGTPVTRRRARTCQQRQPALVPAWAPARSTRRCRTTSRPSWPTTSAPRCGPATRLRRCGSNDADGDPQSYLRNAAGQPVYQRRDQHRRARQFTGTQALSGDFSLTRERLLRTMHGLSLKSHSGGEWDWEAAASLYDYGRDDKRQNAAGNPLPGAWTGGAGTLAEGSGTGWNTLALKGTLAPGRQQPRRGLRPAAGQLQAPLPDHVTLSGNYLSDGPGTLANSVSGNTRLVKQPTHRTPGSFANDAGRLCSVCAPKAGRPPTACTAVLGHRHAAAHRLRHAHASTSSVAQGSAVLAGAMDNAVLKASVGRAVRMPTVAELYGATSTTNSQYINDPNLQARKVVDHRAERPRAAGARCSHA